jgi:hypothetical protein
MQRPEIPDSGAVHITFLQQTCWGYSRRVNPEMLNLVQPPDHKSRVVDGDVCQLSQLSGN